MIAAREAADRLVGVLGRAGAAGVAVLLAAALVEVAVAWPMASRQAGLEASAAQAARLAADPRAARSRVRVDPAERLQAFYASFPPGDSTLRWLTALDEAARRSGVAVQAGQYRMEPVADLPLRRYRLLLPVTGSYLQLRAFIAAVLANVPAAALEDVQLARDAAPGGALTAKLGFSIYLREAR